MDELEKALAHEYKCPECGEAINPGKLLRGRETEARRAASRDNGKKGGRPKRVKVGGPYQVCIMRRELDEWGNPVMEVKYSPGRLHATLTGSSAIKDVEVQAVQIFDSGGKLVETFGGEKEGAK